uniref:Uncharacterized protein n=1 Tax=Arundo donax TaxID=35708 RepID=A0A0A9GLX1_ARUDO
MVLALFRLLVEKPRSVNLGTSRSLYS